MTEAATRSGGWRRAGAVLLLLAVGGLLGYLARGCVGGGPGAAPRPTGQPELWVCPMNITNHPYYSSNEPGKCKFCGMDLVQAAGDAGSAARLTLSENARALAEIETAPVERKFVQAEVRLVGTVSYDETRVRRIKAYFPGRLDRLYADYTGVPVRAGDRLAEIYSPELLAAQAELLAAQQAAVAVAASDLESVRHSAAETLAAVREKLRLWGLTEEQVAGIERAGRPSDRLTVYSPLGGVVIEKAVVEGDYVETGSRLFTVADLSQLWLQLEAYEADVAKLRLGQPVEFTAEALPGERFTGPIEFIAPTLDEMTRTVRLRVSVENAAGRLKPGYFVRAVARPEVAVTPGAPPLVIPAGAPLITGRRALVYVAVPDAKEPTYEGREVVLGPRAGDYYLVERGLREGEQVVVRGNFKIDSALQLQGKPSLLDPHGGGGGAMPGMPGMEGMPATPTSPPAPPEHRH